MWSRVREKALREARVGDSLQYLGVLDSIEIRNAGFSTRLAFEEFFHRFEVLVPQAEAPRGGPGRCRKILKRHALT